MVMTHMSQQMARCYTNIFAITNALDLHLLLSWLMVNYCAGGNWQLAFYRNSKLIHYLIYLLIN